MKKKGISNRKIEIAENMVAELLNYLLLFVAAYIVILDLIGDEPDLPGLFLVGLVPVLYYGLRERCKSLPLFLGLHILIPVLFFLIRWKNPASEVIMAILLLILTAASIVKRVTSDRWGMDAVHPAVAVGVFTVLYLLDQGLGEGRGSSFLLGTLLCFVAGSFVDFFLWHFISYIDMNNRTTDHIPVYHVFCRAAFLMGVFVSMTVALIFLCLDRELLAQLGTRIRLLLVGAVNFLLSLLPLEPDIREESAWRASVGDGFSGLMQTAREPSFLMKLIDLLISVFSIVTVVLLLAGLVWGIWRMIRAGFAGGRRKRAEQPEAMEDQVESLERGNRGREKKPFFVQRLRQALTPEERIRRIYKKTLEQELSEERKRGRQVESREKMLRTKTARECCMVFFAEHGQEAGDFAGLYEKARYRAGCDQEDVRKARSLSKSLLGKG